MNILKHELNLYKKTTIIWTVSLVFIIGLFSMIFPSFSKSASLFEDILSNFPEGLRNALGMSSMNLSEPLGFYGFMFLYITLTGSIQAMNLGLSILSNELMDKTADFLMAKPVKRVKIVHMKLLAGFICLVLTNIIFFIAAKISLDLAAETSYSLKILFLFNFSLFMIQMFFYAFGMFLSVFMNKMKTVVPISLGVVFGFFVLNMLNESLNGKPLSIITPFAYFSTSAIYDLGRYETHWFILNLGLIITFIGGTYIRYIKKDMPSV
ncbi:MAG: ABC transporter permease subunit [Clostridia bacterium]|nr:ABC transporter permease subunit [Clostridia bacterium]